MRRGAAWDYAQVVERQTMSYYRMRNEVIGAESFHIRCVFVGFLLYASPVEIVRRKAELDEEEVELYYNKFQRIISSANGANYLIVDTSKGADDTLCQVMEHIAKATSPKGPKH